MDERLTLNDGTVIENSHVIQDGYTLWFYLNGITFGETYELMSDPDKTSKITYQYGENVQDYTGYTDLFCIRRENNGMITGGLNYQISGR